MLLRRQPRNLIPGSRAWRADNRCFFFFLAYLFGWIGFLPLVLTNVGVGVIRVDVPIEFIVVGASTPTIAALCTQWLLDRSFRICYLYSSWQRLLLGSVMGLALVMIALWWD